MEDGFTGNQGDQTNQTLLTNGIDNLEKKNDYVVMKACLSEVRGLWEVFINIFGCHS